MIQKTLSLIRLTRRINDGLVLVICLKASLRNGLKELLMKSYQMPMKLRDRTGLRMVLMVEPIKNTKDESP